MIVSKHSCYSNLFLLLVLLFTGCFHEKPVTKQEALDFAKTLEQSVADKNPDVFNDIFDGQTFKQRIREASNNKIPDNILDQIPSEIKKKSMGDQIIQSAAKGMYQLVKSYEKDGKQHLIFRLYGSGGLNSHDMELIHTGNKVKVADIYIYLSGEMLSKTMADVSVDFGENYKDKPGEDLAGETKKLRKLIMQENYTEASQVFDALPDHVQKEKAFQIIHLEIAEKLQNDQYKKALDDFKKLFPNEPAMVLLSIDIHFLHEEYNEALNDIDKIDSLISNDPFLDFYKGLLYNKMNNDSTALVFFNRLYKNMPEFGDGIVELISIYAKQGDNEKANALITVYQKIKNYNPETLKGIYLLYPGLKPSKSP